MKILNLHAENFKRLKLVDITPKGNTVVISGKNGQGKTSAMDSFMAALAGGDSMRDQPMPIREGQERAEVAVDLGDYKVTRVWTPGGSRVTIEAKDGAVYKRPQELLDSIIGKLSFDPLSFSRMTAKEQREMLLSSVDIGINLAEWEGWYQKAYDRRREYGKEKDKMKAVVDAAFKETYVDIPEEELVVSELVKKLEMANEYNQGLEEANTKVVNLKAMIENLKEQMKVAEEKLVEAQEDLKTYGNGQPRDTAAIKREIDHAEETNKKVRYMVEKKNAEERLVDATKLHDDAQAQMDKLEIEKRDALAKAKMPITGLGFDSEGVTYNGKPLSQASSAEQTKVSMAIAMALNPKLKVVRIMDGSLLDDESMKEVEQMAQERDFQIWIECVRNDGKVGIIIEDGMVKGNNYESKSEEKSESL